MPKECYERVEDAPVDLKSYQELLDLDYSCMKVIEPGTQVKLTTGLEASVAAIMIQKNRISYKIVWQNGTDLKEEWIDDWLIAESGKEPKRRIGFSNGDS